MHPNGVPRPLGTMVSGKLCLFIAASLVAFLSIHAGVVHHYRLDETFQHLPILDSAGAIDGSTPSELLRGRAGVIAGAHDFEESGGDHIDLGPNSALLPADAFTITAWIRYSPEGFDSNERIFDCSDGDAFTAMSSGFNFKAQSGGLRCFVGDSTNTKATANPQNALLSQEQWFLVALRYRVSTAPGTAEDGLLQVTAIPLGADARTASEVTSLTDGVTHNVGDIRSSANLLAGIPSAASVNADLSFDGLMDDIRIHDTVLSDQELADLHNENLAVASCLRWTFSIDGDAEGWTANGVSGSSVTGGDFVITSAGNDPRIESPDNLALDLTGISKVFVHARNGSANDTGAVFFQTDDSPDYVGNRVEFPIVPNDAGYTTYEVDMSADPDWKGTLKRLRIDLPQGASAGSEIRFGRIAVGASGNRPNVIVMMADDLGWRDVSVNGSTFYQTPNVERLADAGVNYPKAHAAHPLCSPTRGALLTGLYPGRLRYNGAAGHVANEILDPGVATGAASDMPSAGAGTRSRLPNAYVTYAELLKKEGYSTAFIGKWHLGRDEYIPDNQGFDFVIGGRQHPGPPGGYFSPFDNDSNIPTTLPDGSPVGSGKHVNDVLAAWAADYIEDNRNRPFLMNMWWYDVHTPFEAKADVRAKYVGQSSDDGRQRSATMAAMVEVMDDGIGVILDKLEAMGLTDDTIIFFTSDNGGMMYQWISPDGALATDNFPARGAKATVWDGGTRVPFIVNWPGVVSGGTESTDNVNNMSIYSTILDMLDIEPYDGYPVDSITLVPSLLGQPPANNNTVYNMFSQIADPTGTFPAVWVRQGDMKLLRFFNGNGGQGNHRYELYNIALDPGEEDNLADDNPALVTQLDALIEQHLIDTDALIPNANPNYIPPAFDGWTPNYGVRVFDEGGPIRMLSNSYLPALDSPANLSSKATPAKVEVSMTSRSWGDGRIWWRFPGDTEWLPAQSTSFSVTHDNTKRTLSIPIAPGAQVQQIRFQPSSGYFETDVDFIRILDSSDNVIEAMPADQGGGDGNVKGDFITSPPTASTTTHTFIDLTMPITGEDSVYVTATIDTNYDTIIDQNGFDLLQILNSSGNQIAGLGESGGGNTTWNASGFLTGPSLDTSQNPDLTVVFRIDQVAEQVFLYINPDLAALESANTPIKSYTDAAGFGAIPNSIDVIRYAGGGDSPNTLGYSDVRLYTGEETPFALSFADWISGFPGVGAETGLDQDPDGDGTDSGVENFFGTDPGAFSTGLIAGTVSGGTFSFTHPQGSKPAPELTATYRWSTDLTSFHNDGDSVNGTTVNFTVQADTPEPGISTVAAAVTGTPVDRLFVKVEVSE